jgi:hypothetical protein
MMELRPDIAVALGRRFPGLRSAAAGWVIKSVALANLQFSMLSAVPGILPITAPFLPGSSFADLIVLTKNQTMMKTIKYYSESKDHIHIMKFGFHRIKDLL